MFDNQAFYDSVSVIAGRAIVTIDPLPEKPKQEEPIVQQPRRIRWWEGDDDTDDASPDTENIPIVIEDKSKSASVSCETLLDSRNLLNLNVDSSVTSKDSPEEKREPKRDQRSPSISKLGRAQTLAVIDDEIKMRKKSLRERRMSRSQTFTFNTSSELPLIRQLSMPKFYLETPEADQIESAIVKTPSSALSPVQPRNRFNFDLRSVVQMEKEKDYYQTHAPVHGEQERSSRLAHIRGKLNPLKIKRQPSVNQGPNTILHM